MNYELRIAKWAVKHVIFMICALPLVTGNSASLMAQQPQAPDDAPVYAVNAKYVNGLAPGYWATAGAGLTLKLSSGTAYCGNPPSPVAYVGGTLTMSSGTTNYVYLDPVANCAPTVNTTGFSVGVIPLAEVVAGASTITTITDERTWSSPNPAAMSTSGAVQISALGTNQNITLTPSGTGASVITNLVDNGGQVFNVKAHGAKGDGTTNDSPAFQAAIDAAYAAGGGTVLIPPPSSCYLLSTPLNLTGIGKVRVQGTGSWGGGVATGATAQICANTGGILFDVSGSNTITFENVSATAQSGVTTPSLIAVYAARNSSGAGAQGINVRHCYFAMPLHYSGTTYSFGLYLYGSEIDDDDSDWITADYPLVVTRTNAFSQHSAFITEASGTVSNVGSYFNNMELDTSGLGPAAYFNGTQNMTLTGHSWNFSQNASYPAGLYNYALQIIGANNAMFVNWRQEGFPGFAYIAQSVMNSTFMGNTSPGPTTPLHAFEFTDASSGLIGNTFNVHDEYSAVSSNYYYDANSGSPTGVALLDSDYFYCGVETNCINIPYGNYHTGAALYVSNIKVSGQAANYTPVVTFTKGTAATADPLNVFLPAGRVNEVSAGALNLSAGVATHTFTTPYTVNLNCTATSTTSNPAYVSAVSKTAVSVAGTGSDLVEWVCAPARN